MRKLVMLCVVAGVGCSDNSDQNLSPDAAVDTGADASQVSENCDLETGEAVEDYAAIADFPTEGCTGLDQESISGLWAAQAEYDFTPTVLRFEKDCDTETLAATIGGITSVGPADYALSTSDGVVLQSNKKYGDFVWNTAYLLCGTDGDTYTGYTATCITQGEEEQECWEQSVRFFRYQRAQGEVESEGLSLVGELGGNEDGQWAPTFVSNVAVRGDIAYLSRISTGVHIIDVSTPSEPIEIALMNTPDDGVNDLEVIDYDGKRYLLGAGNSRGLWVWDVTVPQSPELVEVFPPNGLESVHRFVVEDYQGQKRGYFADGGGPNLSVYDMTNPEAPQHLGTYPTPNPDWGIHALSVKEGVAYINATRAGMLVVDLSEPTDPQFLGRYEDVNFCHASRPITVDNKPYVVHAEEGWDAHADLIDMDPESDTYMTSVGEYQTRQFVSIHNLVVEGTRAYIAYYQDGVRIVDFAEPSEPRLEAYFNTWDAATAPGSSLEGAVDIEVQDGLIYIADTPRGLLILSEN